VQETLTIVDLEFADYERMAELVETYADFPLGTTDAAVVAIAERQRSSRVSLDAWNLRGPGARPPEYQLSMGCRPREEAEACGSRA